jgi:hypothetical protein
MEAQMVGVGSQYLTTYKDASGAYLEGHTPIPGANGGTPQEFGSAITYMRRYAITALLGVATEEDDDGNHASGNGATFQDRARAPQSQPAAPSAPVAAPASSGPIETLTGIVTREGTIKAGGSAQYKLEARQTPDGLHAFGFRLEIDRDKAIPQALVTGQLAEDIIGHHYKKYLPLLGSCFLFILFMNLLGLIPGFLPPTQKMNITVGLALVIFLSTHYFGLRENGVAYLKHFLGPVWWMAPMAHASLATCA